MQQSLQPKILLLYILEQFEEVPRQYIFSDSSIITRSNIPYLLLRSTVCNSSKKFPSYR